MKKLIIILFIISIVSCQKQQTFTHTITKIESIDKATVSYNEIGLDTLTVDLKNQDIKLNRAIQQFQIILTEDKRNTTFNEIPAKYLNLDADLEISRNVFQDYFPEEWKAMKGVAYTSIRIKSKKDNQIFYTKVVLTGSNTEIAHHSEDF